MSFPQHAPNLPSSGIHIKTGKSLEDIVDIVKRTGLTQRNEIRSMFLREYGLGFGDANSLAQEIIEKWIPQATA